jgi:hypothetical protein
VPSCRQRRPPARPGAMPGAFLRRHRHPPRRRRLAPRAAGSGCASASWPASSALPPSALMPAHPLGRPLRAPPRPADAGRRGKEQGPSSSSSSTRDCTRYCPALRPPPAPDTGAVAVSRADAPSFHLFYIQKAPTSGRQSTSLIQSNPPHQDSERISLKFVSCSCENFVLVHCASSSASRLEPGR